MSEVTNEEKATLVGELSAKLVQVMMDMAAADTRLDWTDLMIGAAMAMRGVAAVVNEADPEIGVEKIDAILMRQFLRVMALPREGWKVVKGDGGGKGPIKAGVIPAGKKH
jgi:hypothetical protein